MATRSTAKKTETKGRRGNITPEAREKGAISKSQRGIFNKYIRALQGRAAEKNRDKIAEIDTILSRGSHVRKTPVFKGARRIGTQESEVALLPSDRAKLMAQRARLVASLTRKAPDELRKQFLAILPEYAARNELTREILLSVGVPPEDLAAAGL
jgi:DNA-binding transcriptional regulator YdaS (Cro superfamily)